MEHTILHKSKVFKSNDLLHIKIPVVKHFLLIAIYPFWIAFALFFLTKLGTVKMAGGGEATTFHYVSVILMMIYATSIFLWTTFAKEEINVTRNYITLKTSLFKIGRTKEYDINLIKNMHADVIQPAISIDPDNPKKGDRKLGFKFITGIGNGAICFEYENKEIRIGSYLDKTEAEYIIENINTYTKK